MQAGEEQDGSGPGCRLGEQGGRQVVGGEVVVPGRAAARSRLRRGTRAPPWCPPRRSPRPAGTAVRPAERRAVTAGQEAPAAGPTTSGAADRPRTRAVCRRHRRARRTARHRPPAEPGGRESTGPAPRGPGPASAPRERASATRRRSCATGTGVVTGVGDDQPTRSSPSGITSSRPDATPRPCRGSDRGEGDPAAPGQRGTDRSSLAGGTSLITPLPSPPPSSLDNGSRHRPPGGRPRRRPRGLRRGRSHDAASPARRPRDRPPVGTDTRSSDVLTASRVQGPSPLPGQGWISQASGVMNLA